ncbi:sarcosine oxidase subunit gamma [Labrys sp. KNU-23]|uniref:sarcosine oxidase subunit gamma n=1 Tax=Labrys sp. KNU-23 TaxID=2789216 RepID=UPI0011EED6AF|nr:sarcosine oxidase subunit gamma family protein [Labrys sp. KNU-23]QEN87277.1 sarcosine oxidase subunit gamma [Labrys sp. KNU-23]
MFDAISAGRLEARSAFAGLLKPVGTGAGVTVQDRSGLEIVTLAARKGQEGALAARMQAAYGLRLPNGPKRVVAGTLAALGTGPSAWLVTREAGESNLLVTDLIEAVGTLASVTDQTSGYAVLRVSGPRVRDMFAKGLDIDLHPRAFGPGDAAVTACSHIGVTLWQLDEAPTYEIALFRSMAGSFWHWLGDSAAEFGLAV